MHLAVGTTAFVICLTTTRRPVMSLWIVAGLQGANELVDAYEQMQRGRSIRWSETINDSLWTLVVPLAASAIIAATAVVTGWIAGSNRLK
jgi:hypothetical protein